MGDVCWYNENSLRRNTPDFKVALLISGTQSAARWRMAGDGNYGSTGKWTIKKASQYSPVSYTHLTLPTICSV
eukprot:7386314-Prymnesium_polylepis.3